MKNYLFVFLLITMVGNIFCQTSTGTISGTVTEEKTGEYVISLTVVLYKDSISSRPLRGTYTTKFGYYSFSQLPAGEYYLLARGVGYQQYSKKITLKEGENFRLNIKMKAADVVTEEVIVTAERSPE